MLKRRFFFDADGVLFVFDKEKTFEEICRPGYFVTVKPVFELISAAEELTKRGEDVYILTKVLEDGHSKQDKLLSFRLHLPFIPEENIIFVSYSKEKSSVIPDISPTDILIDDFSPNCREWKGTAVKLYNGYNGNKGTWKGLSINNNSYGKVLADQLQGIAMIIEQRKTA